MLVESWRYMSRGGPRLAPSPESNKSCLSLCICVLDDFDLRRITLVVVAGSDVRMAEQTSASGKERAHSPMHAFRPVEKIVV